MAAFVRGVIEPVGEIERFYSSSVEGSWYTVVPDTKKNVHKVQVFWKGHTYLKKNLYLLWCYQVNVKEKWKIVTNSCSLFRISELWMEKKVDCRKLWLRSYKVEGQTWIVCFSALWWRLLRCQFWKNVTSEKWNSDGLNTLEHPLPSLLCVIATVFSNHAQKWRQKVSKSVQPVRISPFRSEILSKLVL